jgi:hypothetical protein
MLATAPPVVSTRPCVVHRVYENGILVAVDMDDAKPDDPYVVVVLDIDQCDRVGRGDRGILTRVDAGWRGPWRFDRADD